MIESENILGLKKHGKSCQICKTCKREFDSRLPNKIYCSMACYMRDPETKTRIAGQARKALFASLTKRGYSSVDRVKTKCAHCGCELILPFHRVNQKRNFCNRTHYRMYQAQRFDRWIASPQKIALPQNYDEFLTQEILPCIVEGCDWKGLRLANHVNFEHGIRAEEFKKLAGFNLGSGLVPPDESARMRENALIRITRGQMALMPNQKGHVVQQRGNSYVSLEAKEHISKSQALLRFEPCEISEINRCRWCGKRLPKMHFGWKLYCSVSCRTAFYNRKRFELVCSHCGNKFEGNRYQRLASERGTHICCSVVCRNAHNLTLSPNWKRHQEKLRELAQ